LALGGVFEFLEAYCDGDVDIVGEQGLRRLVSLGYRKSFGRFAAGTRTLDEEQHNNFVGNWPTNLPATIGSSRQAKEFRDALGTDARARAGLSHRLREVMPPRTGLCALAEESGPH
jgi:hypothetical protein